MNKEYGQSPDELFDVVDENDQVLYPLSRGEIHKRHLRHRAVHIFWLNQAGELCLQRCAGHVDSGEKYIQAAVREFREELGITIESKDLVEIDYAPCHEKLGNEFVVSYLLKGDYNANIYRPEVDSLVWRTPQQVMNWTQLQPEHFATPFLHLLRRDKVLKSLLG
ncbi:MAG: NUDIX domain-containing protein [Opitutae bacterium]|nr:NUDIX domain-containing protein [Opitutae bacterium]